MPLFVLDDRLTFPAPHLAEPDGLLAMGGDLSPERLILAYRLGIFPWYDGDTILWWSPDPRFILLPAELKIRRSLKPLLSGGRWRLTVNTAFEQVIHHCKHVPRAGQDGTWITDEVEKAYTTLHRLGYATSAEVWEDGELIGGLYGIRLGAVFFGESMFSLKPQASRYAFTLYTGLLKEEGVRLIDCQVYTAYLESMGARLIAGAEFRQMLKQLIP